MILKGWSLIFHVRSEIVEHGRPGIVIFPISPDSVTLFTEIPETVPCILSHRFMSFTLLISELNPLIPEFALRNAACVLDIPGGVGREHVVQPPRPHPQGVVQRVRSASRGLA